MNKINLKRIFTVFFAFLLVLSLASCDVTDLFNDIGGGRSPVGDGSDFVPKEVTEVVKTEFENLYADQLSPNERAFYDAVMTANAGENHFSVTLPEIVEVCKSKQPTPTEQTDLKNKISYWITNALFAVWMDAPELFWLETGSFESKFNIELHKDDIYRVSSVELTVDLKEGYDNVLNDRTRLNAVLDGLSLKGANDAETLKNINDYLCDTILYELTADHRDTAFGALVEGECVCEGYAHAFQLLCHAYDLECVCIFGTGKTEDGEEGHMWNAVRLEGVWYAVDATWNDTTESDAYFLVGSTTVSHGTAFSYSHVAENKRGDSKPFALPVLSVTARADK